MEEMQLKDIYKFESRLIGFVCRISFDEVQIISLPINRNPLLSIYMIYV